MVEVPVGFKWFVPGLIDGSFGFGGEESAGASFLRMDGSTWTTDKDGLLLCLLASEILAMTGETPSKHYAELVAKYGDPAYARVDAPANREEKAKLAALSPDEVTATELAGEPITDKLTAAPGNGAKIGGLKVTTESAWFAARPSGTEDVYKIYAESFRGPEHLAEVQARRARWCRPRWVRRDCWRTHLSCAIAHRAVSATTGSASSVKRSARSRASTGREVGAA